jgi:pyridoxine 5-phosphate synthase
MLRLGINIDHVATLRNARGDIHPCPVEAAHLAKAAGADGITAHLREDRRHIRDKDIYRLRKEVDLPLNLEMAATDEMQKIALDVAPNACCIVPENRTELTTEGGLNVTSKPDFYKTFCAPLKAAGIRVSLFVDPDIAQLDAAMAVGADIVELHTGTYCHNEAKQSEELVRIIKAANHAQKIGLECHAGHGLTYDNVSDVAAIPQIIELNIGHFLMGEAIFIGLENAIDKMRFIMDKARG